MRRSCIVPMFLLPALLPLASLAATIPTPTANPSPATGTTTTLTEGTVTGLGTITSYTWATSGTVPAPVAFTVNGSSSAKTTKAVFTKAGTYNFVVTVKGSTGTGTSSQVQVKVNQTMSTVVFPGSATVDKSSTKKFTAAQYDQFGAKAASQPKFTWTLSNTSVATTSTSSDGLTYTVTSKTTTGSYTITATGNNASGTAVYTIADRGALLTAAKTNIKHVFIIMQENRSFDNYFGKYKPSDTAQKIETIPSGLMYSDKGIAKSPAASGDYNGPDYPHLYANANAIIGDGNSRYLQPATFLAQASGATAVMDYYSATDLPGYYQLAKNFVLQDHMFEAAKSWSKVSHLYLFSGWSAECSTCSTTIGADSTHGNDFVPTATTYDWNSLGGLIGNTVMWRVFKGVGWSRGASTTSCGSADRDNTDDVQQIWNPLKTFNDSAAYYVDTNVGQLSFLETMDHHMVPAVNWIVPGDSVSEHAGEGDLRFGHDYVVSIIQGIMNNSGLWNSSVIFLSWDDWGGLFDHVTPPKTTDGYGYGIRVPGLVISPYAKKGVVDNQILSHDAYAKFIEDLFLNSTRVNSKAGTTKDNRPEQRENDPILGDLLYDFDFSRALPTVTMSCSTAPQ